MTIEKRTLIDHLTHFRKDFGFPNKLRGMIIRHPELFYVSLKGQRHSVFLVEGFGEKGDLLEKEEILSIQDKWMDLARESKRMRRERRKSRFRKDIGSLNEADQNNSDSDDDYDDNIGIDNFENVYDDGFENIFEELDFEAEDDDDDQEDKIFSQSNYREFWTAEPFPIQHGLDEPQMQPW
ncbi:hypothetical protein LR48_Vigan665s000400 [Vigna angularis]|nr:hypothetical protein LR48_Vigan665s000400 [Vigna angularis]